MFRRFIVLTVGLLLPVAAAAQVAWSPTSTTSQRSSTPTRKTSSTSISRSARQGARSSSPFTAARLRAGDKSGAKFVGQRFASAGNVTVVVNHRLSPGVMHPAHIEDIAVAVAWVKGNIARHGGDPDKLFVVGHSAGAYLAALLALDPRYLAAHGLTPQDVRGFVPVSGFFYVDRTGVAPDRPKDVWGTDVKVWKDASPAHVHRAAHTAHAPALRRWRRRVAAAAAGGLREGARGRRQSRRRSADDSRRTHNTVWTEMAKGDEDTSRAILQFVNRLMRGRHQGEGTSASVARSKHWILRLLDRFVEHVPGRQTVVRSRLQQIEGEPRQRLRHRHAERAGRYRAIDRRVLAGDRALLMVLEGLRRDFGRRDLKLFERERCRL